MNSATPHEVVVTGMGVATAAGVGLDEFHAGQLAAKGTARPITRYDAEDDPIRFAGEVDLPPDLAMSRRDELRTDRCTALALASAAMAVEHAKIDWNTTDRARVGVVVGSGVGGASTWETACRALYTEGVRAVRARSIPMSMLNNPASALAFQYGLTGACTTAATACAAGADALIAGQMMIQTGEADMVLAGGAESPVVRTIVAGFARLQALAVADDPTCASRPFDVGRNGFVIAEGAAVLVLESAEHAAARGAQVHARFTGFGRSSDAYHSTAPHPDGAGAATAVRAALRSAGVSKTDIDFVNAHGTSTKLNDSAEAAALRTVFGAHADTMPLVATKAVTGHSLGASGAIEAVATIQALQTGLLPATANLNTLDPALDVDVVHGSTRKLSAALALSNSFAFGGHNVVLAFSRA
jgi:3-oxoacyl-[acyl-carrier-protein] synthase II